MNNYEEIKKLVESSRKIFSNLNENDKKEIRGKYSLLTEEMVDEKKYETADTKKDSDEIGKPSEKQKGYKIQGDVLILHGQSEVNLQLTSDEKNAFVESMDEFRTDVAELVKFDKMNVFPENVEWAGKILELNLEFFFTINEPHGIYINGEMVKVDEEYLETLGKLQAYYEKFKNKWSKIVASRAREKMREFLVKNWKTITLTFLGVIFVYLLVRVFTPTPQMSDLNKYKLEQIDKHINEMKNLQKSLSDSIQAYEKKINEIDNKISNIKIEKKEVNNFYTQKKEEIQSADKRQIDSLLRKRYNF